MNDMSEQQQAEDMANYIETMICREIEERDIEGNVNIEHISTRDGKAVKLNAFFHYEEG